MTIGTTRTNKGAAYAARFSEPARTAIGQDMRNGNRLASARGPPWELGVRAADRNHQG